jgi:hypothetical protein
LIAESRQSFECERLAQSQGFTLNLHLHFEF